jgi:hypothetical protein
MPGKASAARAERGSPLRLKVGQDQPEEKKGCRKDGHFCGTGMVCCSFRCNLTTNTCY